MIESGRTAPGTALDREEGNVRDGGLQWWILQKLGTGSRPRQSARKIQRGSQIGKVLTYPLTALLCEYGFDGGWPSVFYVQGIFGLSWFLLWCLLVFDSPAKHPRISQAERTYIETSLKGRIATTNQKHRSPPWLSILTSSSVWAIIVAHVCCNWGEYTFLTNIPTYLNEVLQYDVKKNGFMSSVPYIFFWLVISLSSWLADIVRTKRLLNTLLTRKLFTNIG
ncbi:vesicular glutamate transporter 3 [Elysia marginata]|uniref:Vesicular glutamate transporter 3 n=1 Tax=Elysia marginata TaxID=1093978 RepID=A0AAV4IF39_9GAST|nr:vesicular glutamate transporter 3 [Elysia marginata]